MKTEVNETHVCPRCEKIYSGHPSISRTDGETHICPDCGIREALESIGISAKEQDLILESIHRSYPS